MKRYFALLLLLLPLLQSCASQELLRPEQAFKVHLDALSQEALIARWDISRGYYLYHEQLRFAVVEADAVNLGEIQRERGHIIEDEFFGRVEIHRQQVQALIPFVVHDPDLTQFTLIAHYQGCADAGICYPPLTQELRITLTPTLPARLSTTGFNTTEAVAPQNAQDRLAAQLGSGKLLWTLLVFFGLGLLLAFTPCVFPMIPILSNIILGEKSLTAGRAFAISLSFVMAMALTYTLAGVAAALAGASLQAAMQNPWVIGAFVGVLGLLALSLFGFYELRLPSALQTRIARLSGTQRSGSFIGAAIMGIFSALLVSPCTTAPLLGALLYISQSGDALLGGLALFSLSLGMGLPLLLIGTSAATLLPKAGAWMEQVKAVFGVLILALGIWLLERIFSPALTLWLWAMLCIISAVAMGALQALPQGASGLRSVWRGLGVVLLIYGVLLLIGASSGAQDPLRPLAAIFYSTGSSANTGPQGPQTDSPSPTLQFHRVTTLAELNTHLQQAQARQQPVLVDFYADWCVDCVRMKRTTFTDSAVASALSAFYLIQADITQHGPPQRELLQRFTLFGPPALLFYNREGREMSHLRLVGYISPQRLRTHLQILAN